MQILQSMLICILKLILYYTVYYVRLPYFLVPLVYVCNNYEYCVAVGAIWFRAHH